MTAREQLVAQLQTQVDELRKSLESFDKMREELRQYEKALAVLIGTPSASGDRTNTASRLYLVLQANPEGLSQADAARQADITVAMAKYHLDKMIRRREVRVSGRGQGARYLPMPKGEGAEAAEAAAGESEGQGGRVGRVSHGQNGKLTSDDLLKVLGRRKMELLKLAKEVAEKFAGRLGQDPETIQGRVYPMAAYLVKSKKLVKSREQGSIYLRAK